MSSEQPWRPWHRGGAPFFVVATSSPLLQAWYASTGSATAKDPYWLYAASNAGSLLALLGYPLLVQPALTLKNQANLWSIGYVLLVVLFAGCALSVPRRSHGLGEILDHEPSVERPPVAGESYDGSRCRLCPPA